MGNKSYLTLKLKADLLKYLAGTGENYNKYLEWCDMHSVPIEHRFTQKYLHTWIQRRRPKFQAAREDHDEKLRTMSMYDRDRRIADLEQSANIINSHIMAAGKEYSVHQCTKCGYTHEIAGPEVVIKLLEQKRKLLQAIAQERNEWGKGEPEETKAQDLNSRLREAAIAALGAATKTTYIDA